MYIKDIGFIGDIETILLGAVDGIGFHVASYLGRSFNYNYNKIGVLEFKHGWKIKRLCMV